MTAADPHATTRQLDLLQTLTGVRWDGLHLTKPQAQEAIDALLRVKEKVSPDAARKVGQQMYAKIAAGGWGEAGQDAAQEWTKGGDAAGEGEGGGQGEGEQQQPSGNAVMEDAHVDGQHRQFPKLLTFVEQREHAFLVGPAGTGKTHAAMTAADTVGVGWTYWAANPRVTASALLGMLNADGKYIPSPFRDAYENGKVFILDELDNTAEDLPVTLNGALSNDHAAFPDGVIKRHRNFCVIATGNTYGKGANRVYSGRNQLDGATLDRFGYLEWGYDERLEADLAPVQSWTRYVQAVRAVVLENGIREVVSMRASIKGGKFLKLGWSWLDVENTWLYKGWNKDSLAKVKAVREAFASTAENWGDPG